MYHLLFTFLSEIKVFLFSVRCRPGHQCATLLLHYVNIGALLRRPVHGSHICALILLKKTTIRRRRRLEMYNYTMCSHVLHDQFRCDTNFVREVQSTKFNKAIRNKNAFVMFN